MINSIKINSLRNSEFVQFVKDVLRGVKKNDPSLLNVQPEYDGLVALLKSLEAALTIPSGNIITTALEELDNRRDNALNGINATIAAAAYSTKPGLATHAALLTNHLSVLGPVIATDNYQSETAKISVILNDWATKPALAAAVTALGLQDWLTELSDANNSFDDQYGGRAFEMGTVSSDKMKTLRSNTNDAYYLLRDNLNARFIINKGADPFAATVGFINGYVDNYNNLLSRRNGSSEFPVAAAAPAPVV